MNGTHCLENSLAVSSKLNTDLASPLLSIHPREKEVYIHTVTGTQMLLKALFVISKNWKQPEDARAAAWRTPR